MDEAIRRAALRATAKVALSLTVFGCAGQVEVEPAAAPEPKEEPAPESPEPEPEQPAPAATLDGPVEKLWNTDPLVCDAEPPGGEVELDEEQLACCLDHLGPVLPTTAEQWQSWQSTEADPDVQGCCNVLVAHVDADWSVTATTGYEAVMACCQAIGNPTGPACTPWGPPAPPSFAPELAAAWELEVA